MILIFGSGSYFWHRPPGLCLAVTYSMEMDQNDQSKAENLRQC